MANWLTKRRLSSNASRIRTLETDLAVNGEQLRSLRDDAEDEATRAIVADNTGVTRDARRAREHVEALERHRRKIADEITHLEQRQDELLDQLARG